MGFLTFLNENTEVNIIIESTVPVGSAEKLYHKIVKQDIVKNIMIFSSPERYLETYQPSDFPTRTDYNHPFELHKDYTHSEYKIIGICDPDGMDFEEIPYKRIQNYMDAWQNTGIEFIMVLNSNEAELSKLLENHLRYTQITTMNLFKDYIENISSTYGFRANPDNIFEAMRTKGYINYGYCYC
jgi:UDP-N-acetyl-D-mannosaminuronate dehydrogenase